MIDLLSTAISIGAVVIAVLSWNESRKRGYLLEDIAKSLKYIARPVKKESNKAHSANSSRSAESLKQQAEERKRIKLQLEQEKFVWQKQKDLAKAIGWLADRLGEEDYED